MHRLSTVSHIDTRKHSAAAAATRSLACPLRRRPQLVPLFVLCVFAAAVCSPGRRPPKKKKVVSNFGGAVSHGNDEALLGPAKAARVGGAGGEEGAEGQAQPNTRRALCISLMTMLISIPALIGA